MPLNMVTAGPAVQGGLEVGGSSEMDHIESSVLDLCISISCIPGKRCCIRQSSSLRVMPTDGHSCEWSGTNIPSNSGTGVSPLNRGSGRSSRVYTIGGLSPRSHLGL